MRSQEEESDRFSDTMENHKEYSTWAEVDCSAIENNVRSLRERTDKDVMAVVKANGYGHGAVKVAEAARRGGAKWFAVARIEEALELKRAGIEEKILVLGWIPVSRIAELVLQKASLTVWTEDHINTLDEIAISLNERVNVHLKIDTGMSRLGTKPNEAIQMVDRILNSESLHLEGVLTHFARADEENIETTDVQLKLFNETLEGIYRTGAQPSVIHSANSAATLTRPQTWFDLVRIGIAMYGLCPSEDCPIPASFRPALAWKSTLAQVKLLPPGRGVSYGHIYTTQHEERIGTVPVGYADGFRRTKGNELLVRGKRVPVVGRVTMDHVLVQLDTVPDAEEGDEVVILGSQGQERITADEIAKRWGTVNYEVTCGLSARVPRTYISDC